MYSQLHLLTNVDDDLGLLPNPIVCNNDGCGEFPYCKFEKVTDELS
jgi:hypothetical protein